MTTMLEQQTDYHVSVLGGLAGFARSEHYALVEVPGGGPLFRLSSLDEPGLEFLVVPPGAFFPDYAPVIDDASAERVGLITSDDAMLLVVLTLGSTAAEATANLLAPLVVNQRTQQAAQVVVEGGHPLRAPLRP